MNRSSPFPKTLITRRLGPSILLFASFAMALFVSCVADAVYFDAGVTTNEEQDFVLGSPLADLKLVGNSYSGVKNLRFEVVSGSLPAGVVLDEKDGKFYSTSLTDKQGDDYILVNPAVPNAAGITQAIIRVTDTGSDAPRPHQDYVILTVTVEPPETAVGAGDIADNSTITFEPTNFLIGSGSSTITLTLRDGNGPITNASPNASVRIGSVGQMTHDGDGVYTAEVTSQDPGTSIITIDNLPGGAVLESRHPITFRSFSDDPEPWLEVPSEERVVTHFLGTPVPVAPKITTNLEENETLEQARVEVVGYVEGDELGFWDGATFSQSYSKGGLVGTWEKPSEDEDVWVLEFQGTASSEAYEEALRAVHYRYDGQSTSPVPDKLVRISLVVLDDRWAHDPATGHFYQSRGFEGPNMTWKDTEIMVGSETFYGMQGYLATITSAHENNFVTTIVDKNAWIGTFDLANDLSRVTGGEVPRWAWMTGPETGQVFWIGQERSEGGWSGVGEGTTVPGMYSNWNSGEPNRSNTNQGFEAFGTIFGEAPPEGTPETHRGLWNDLPNQFLIPPGPTGWLDGYVIEYGGMDGDPQVKFFEDIVVRVEQGPVVEFSAEPEQIRFGETVTFTNLSYFKAGSDDPDRLKQFAKFEWNYGDGNTHETTGTHPLKHDYTYTKLGEHTVKLRGQELDGNGRPSEWEEQTVTVTADLLGYVFLDSNGSGKREAGESGIGAELDFESVDVLLIKNGNVFARARDTEGDHTYDSSTGQYRFTGLFDGDYEVQVVKHGTSELYIPEDWIATTSGGEAKQSLWVPEQPAAMPDAPGTVRGPDIGYAPARVVIGGTVFIDDGRDGGAANDGQRNGGELGVFGVRLRVFDENSNELHPVLTDAVGRYEAEIAGGKGYVELDLRGISYNATGYTERDSSNPTQLTQFNDSVKVQFNNVAPGTRRDGIDFGVVPQFTSDGTNPGTAASGGVQVYPFVLRPGTQGEVEFEIETPRGWQYSIYRDVNGNGELDSGEPVVGEGSQVAVSPGEERFLLVVRVPTWENDGQIDMAQVTATLTYDNNSSLKETQRFYSMTTVQSTRLQLTAYVRNVSQNEPEGEGHYSRTMVNGKQGDLIEYYIVYHNIDGTTAADVTLHGSIPAGTTLVDDRHGNARPVAWKAHHGGTEQHPSIVPTAFGFALDVGDVLPGQSGSFTYRVIVD